MADYYIKLEIGRPPHQDVPIIKYTFQGTKEQVLKALRTAIDLMMRFR